MEDVMEIFIFFIFIAIAVISNSKKAKNVSAGSAGSRRKPSASYRKANQEFGREGANIGKSFGDAVNSGIRWLDSILDEKEEDAPVLSGGSNRSNTRKSVDETHSSARYATRGYDTQDLDFCDSFISRSRGISFSNRPANMDELTYLAKCNAKREKEIETQMRHKHFDE